MEYQSRSVPWSDHYASASMLAADPALLFEAIEEQAEQACARMPELASSTARAAFRRQLIDDVYSRL